MRVLRVITGILLLLDGVAILTACSMLAVHHLGINAMLLGVLPATPFFARGIATLARP